MSRKWREWFARCRIHRTNSGEKSHVISVSFRWCSATMSKKNVKICAELGQEYDNVYVTWNTTWSKTILAIATGIYHCALVHWILDPNLWPVLSQGLAINFPTRELRSLCLMILHGFAHGFARAKKTPQRCRWELQAGGVSPLPAWSPRNGSLWFARHIQSVLCLKQRTS